jgi:glutamyl-tRNA synthetase
MQAFSEQFLGFVRSVSPESRLRLAPTPSGFLHLGNALNFTLNWLAAKSMAHLKGVPYLHPSPQLFLRIDDLDADRKRPEYIQDITDSLNWLRLDWEGAPVFQSDESRMSLYHKILQQLRDRNLLFACQKSRRDLEPFGGAYPTHFREQNCSLDAPDVAWRIKTPPGFPLPDFVVRRRDGIPAYQVASFADDVAMGVTHVIRGADLEHSTEAQHFLATVLSEDKFLKINFLHHPLLLGDSGEKLSKSAGSSALKTLRETEQGPEIVFQTIGTWLGLEGNTAESLLDSLRKKLA